MTIGILPTLHRVQFRATVPNFGLNPDRIRNSMKGERSNCGLYLLFTLRTEVMVWIGFLTCFPMPCGALRAHAFRIRYGSDRNCMSAWDRFSLHAGLHTPALRCRYAPQILCAPFATPNPIVNSNCVGGCPILSAVLSHGSPKCKFCQCPPLLPPYQPSMSRKSCCTVHYLPFPEIQKID